MSKPQIELFALTAHTLRYLGKSAGIFPFGIYSDWKHLLPEIFHEHYSETEILNSIDNSFKEKWTDEKTLDELKTFTDKAALSKLLVLYLELLKKSDNLIAYKKLKIAYNSLFEKENFGLKQTEEVSATVDEWIEKSEKNSFRPIISIPVTLYIVFLDFALRTLLLSFRNSGSETFAGSLLAIDFTDNTNFILSNILIVPAIVGLSGFLFKRRNAKITTKTLNTLDLAHIKINPSISAWDYFILGCMALVGVGIGEMAIDGFTDNSAFTFFFLSFLLMIYLLLILRFFSLPTPSSTQIYHKLKERDQIEVEDDLSSDDNDIEIVNLEVRLRSLTEKMNAFVIEAALFGALAFSGFIQVIAAEIFELSAFAEFNSTILELARGFVTDNSENFSTSFNALLHRNTLLSLLCYESLFCSICFLSVIASRMRFSDLTDMLDKALALSKNFNQKEEGLILHQNLSRESKQVKHYSNLIRLNLQNGLKDYNKIKPVLEYMRFFRTMGIGSFFIIIITGGLFISPFVSLIFSIIFVISLIYFKFPVLAAGFMQFKTRIQEYRAKTARKANWAFIALLILVTAYRSFYLPHSSYLLLYVGLIISMHQLLLLIEGKTFSITSKIFTRFFRFGVITFIVGIGFKSAHFPGASLFLILGTFLLAIFFSFHTIKADKKWIIRALSIGMSVVPLGMLFKIQHYPGATILKNIGIAAIVISAILSFYKFNYKTFPLFYQWSLGVSIGLVILIIPYNGIGYKSITALNVDITDLKKFHKFEEWRSTLWDLKKVLAEDDKKIDYVTNEELKNNFDLVTTGELSWLRNESILGLYIVSWLSDSHSFLNNQKDWIAKYSDEQLQTLIEINDEVVLNCINESPQYLMYHGKELQDVIEYSNFQKAYLFHRLNEPDSANKYLQKLRTAYDGENDQLWDEVDVKLEKLIKESLATQNSQADSSAVVIEDKI